MANTWVLITNASTAFLYGTERHKLLSGQRDALEQIKELHHSRSRQKDGEIVSDRLGNFSGKSTGHGSFVDASDPKAFEAEYFAKELAQLLEAGRVDNKYKDLIIVSSPHFHGLLNKKINQKVSSLISSHIKKDYTKQKVQQLPSLLKEHLFK